MSAAERDSTNTRVSLALIWHMHQPDYRDPTGVGDMVLPWVRLHCCRAYSDVAWLLERHPHIRATVSISPVLADQIDDLAHLRCGDRYLDLSRRPAEDLSHLDKMEILAGFFMTDWERNVRPLPRYWSLLHKRGRNLKSLDLDRVAKTFTESELCDLQVLFNLVWMGSMARATHPLVQNLLRKGRGFTEIEKVLLLDLQEHLVCQVLPRWRALATRGQVELCTSPYFQPILPLLIDTDSAREADPEARLPPRCRRSQDAVLQLERAIESHERHFGVSPAGLLPSEGSVSHQSAILAAQAGFSWMVSDEVVLRHSIIANKQAQETGAHLDVWEVSADSAKVALFFRDKALSDLVGFSYSRNPPAKAAKDMIKRLATAADRHQRSRDNGPSESIVTLALNSEGPWEHYPDSGRPFLEALFRELASADHHGVTIRTTTPSKWLADHTPRACIRRLHAGSWVNASFKAWIGCPERNKAWKLIDQAGRLLDARGASMAPENREEALNHLLAAEGSDWTWWYGDDFVTETPEAFDALFRARLLKIYELTGEATPQPLRRAISPAAAKGQALVPLQEPWSLITPLIDGEAAPYVDWQGAGVYRPGRNLGKMYRSSSMFTALYYGCDQTEMYLRLDPSPEARGKHYLGELSVQLVCGDRELDILVSLRRGTGHASASSSESSAGGIDIGRYCYGDIVEMALPFEPLGLPPGEVVLITVRNMSEHVEIERLPRYGHLTLRIPERSQRLGMWKA